MPPDEPKPTSAAGGPRERLYPGDDRSLIAPPAAPVHRARSTLTVLAERFPRVFTGSRPLKLGIGCDIAAALAGEITKTQLKRALRYYTNNIHYLRACTVGAARVSLDGNACGSVSADEAAHARGRVEAIRAAGKARRAALQRPAPQPNPTTSSAGRLSLRDLKDAALRRKAGTFGSSESGRSGTTCRTR
jgi:sRNA-binding protein